MSKTSRKQKRHPISSRRRARREPGALDFVWWIAVCLTVFVQVPKAMAGDYLGKTLAAAICLGAAFLFLRPELRRPVGLTPLGAIWLSLGVWALASMLWAVQPRVTFERWIALFAFPTMAYLVARRTRFWESETFWTAYCWIFSVLCLIGCLQFVLPIEFLKPWFPKQNLFPWIISTALPSATLGNRQYAGEYLAVTFPLVLWRFLKCDGKASVSPFVATGLGAAFILFTRARATWVALTAAFVLIAVLGAVPRILRRRRNLLILTATAVAVLAAGVVLHPSVRVRTRGRSDGLGAMPVYKESLWQSAKSTISDLRTNKRLAMWKFALSVRTNPFVGCGWGNFPIAATPFHPEKKVYTLNYEVHSDILQYYVDLGVVGLALVLGFLGYLALLIYRQRKDDSLILAAGAAAFALDLVLSVTFLSEKVSTQLWTAGMIAVINDRSAQRPWRRFDASPRARSVFRLGAALALFVFAVLVALTAWGDRQFRREMASRPPNFDRLARHVLPRMQFEPNMIHILTHETAKGAVHAKSYDAAEILARKALSLHPSDVIALQDLVAVAESRSDWRAAADGLERVLRISPRLADFDAYRRLANLYERLGQEDKAKEYLDKALAVRPKSKAPKASR